MISILEIHKHLFFLKKSEVYENNCRVDCYWPWILKVWWQNWKTVWKNLVWLKANIFFTYYISLTFLIQANFQTTPPPNQFNLKSLKDFENIEIGAFQDFQNKIFYFISAISKCFDIFLVETIWLFAKFPISLHSSSFPKFPFFFVQIYHYWKYLTWLHLEIDQRWLLAPVTLLAYVCGRSK